VYSLKYHLVWCPEYRRKILVGPVEAELKALLARKTLDMGVTIEALEVMPDTFTFLFPSRQRFPFRSW